jgi:glycerol uptake facilitator protein
MQALIAEYTGTALLLLIGGGVVANVVLSHTKGQSSGWLVITIGWGIAVFLGVYSCVKLGGPGHLNPAVTIAMAAAGIFPAADIPGFILAQLGGAITGAVVVWIAYQDHFEATSDPVLKRAVFCTAPAIRAPLRNCITEFIATFTLVFGALCISPAETKLGALDALPVALLVLGIGLGLGGPTGYAINPARDLGPRIVHAMLPIPGKANSDWSYSWVPVIAPILGGVAAALLFKTI